MTLEFVDFEDPDADRPGIVVVQGGTNADQAMAEWWPLIIRQAWEDDWCNGPDDPFVGAEYADVADEFEAWARSRVKPPQWRWWTWGPHDPDCEGDCEGDCELGYGCNQLTKADKGEDGAFLGALVLFVDTPAASSETDGDSQ